MKKTILILTVTVFSLYSFTVVENFNPPDEIACSETAWNSASELEAQVVAQGGNTFSEWDMWALTDYYFDQCMEG